MPFEAEILGVISEMLSGYLCRMNEFEAAVLLGQLPGVKERFARRNENAAYLAAKLKDFPGVVPQKLYEGTSSGAYYVVSRLSSSFISTTNSWTSIEIPSWISDGPPGELDAGTSVYGFMHVTVHY